MSYSENGESVGAACFTVNAAASPGVLPRLVEPFAKRGLVPGELHSRRHGDTLAVEIRIDGMTAELAEYLAACLRQIYLVDRVLLSMRRAADAA